VLERRRGAARFVSDVHLVPKPGRGRLIRRWLKRHKRPKAVARERKPVAS
jgi:hypothetical protein